MVWRGRQYMEQLELNEKCKSLKQAIAGMDPLAVAFSAGVDSTFLLKIAKDVLGHRVLAVTVRSCLFPRRESDEAETFCRTEGIRQVFVDADPLAINGFADNPENRCYLCKRDLFEKIRRKAKENGIENVADGSNLDDGGDYRPGLQAIEELGIKSPLREARLTKEEIRFLSREMGLPTWEKPSFACLASRFVYRETITVHKLEMVGQAEQLLFDMGFSQVRVRIHGYMARIELLPEEFTRLTEETVRTAVVRELKRMGFTYVAMDLAGYRSGSMNEHIR